MNLIDVQHELRAFPPGSVLTLDRIARRIRCAAVLDEHTVRVLDDQSQALTDPDAERVVGIAASWPSGGLYETEDGVPVRVCGCIRPNEYGEGRDLDNALAVVATPGKATFRPYPFLSLKKLNGYWGTNHTRQISASTQQDIFRDPLGAILIAQRYKQHQQEDG